MALTVQGIIVAVERCGERQYELLMVWDENSRWENAISIYIYRRIFLSHPLYEEKCRIYMHAAEDANED
jgi:hypothetical protein